MRITTLSTRLLLSLGFLALGTLPVAAQTVETCFMAGSDTYVPIGRNYPSRQPEPARIQGDEPGSQVNVRSGPGGQHTAIAAGIVGNYVDVIGQALDGNCDTWVKVRFPDGREGWIFARYIDLTYGRGWWD